MKDTVLALSPSQKRKILMGYCRCMYEFGEYETSIKLGQAAIALGRHHAGVHKYVALSQQALGRIEESIRRATQAAFYEAPWDDENRTIILQLRDELVASKAPYGKLCSRSDAAADAVDVKYQFLSLASVERTECQDVLFERASVLAEDHSHFTILDLSIVASMS